MAAISLIRQPELRSNANVLRMGRDIGACCEEDCMGCRNSIHGTFIDWPQPAFHDSPRATLP
jgi:hypothetical protein